VSIPAEDFSFWRLKIRPVLGGRGLQMHPVGVKIEPAGEAEAGSAGEQPAEE
jgi:hypothetical protein